MISRRCGFLFIAVAFAWSPSEDAIAVGETHTLVTGDALHVLRYPGGETVLRIAGPRSGGGLQPGWVDDREQRAAFLGQ